jgi:succinoglycan biosynthesis transport protein ExoP
VKPELEFHPGRLPGHADLDQEADRLPINYLALASRNRWWLAGGLLCGLLVGEGIYFKLGPEYEASAQILVSRKNAVPIKEEQRTLGNWGERTEHIALIQSPMIANKAVEIGQLQNLPTFRNSPDPAEDVLDDLKVKRSAGQDRSFLNVLNITFSSKNAEDARAVVEAVIAAYAQYLDETRQEQSSEVLALALKARDEISEKLHKKEQEYLAFREKAPLQWRAPVGANNDGQGTTTNVHQERVLAIEEQRRLILLQEAELRSRLTAIEQAVKEGQSRDSLEILVRRFLNADGPNSQDAQQQREVQVFETKLLPLLLEEERLARDFGKDHPELQSVRNSIQTTLAFYRQHGIRLPDDKGPDGKPTRRSQTDFVAVYTDSLRQQLAELKNRDRELSEVFDRELAKAKELARFQAQDQALNAEISQIRELWEHLTTQVNQVDIEKDSNGYTLKQIAPAKSATSIKRLVKFLAAGALAGLGAVAICVFLREWRDSTLKSTKDLQLCLRQPILGSMRQFYAPVDRAGPQSGRPHPALRYWHAPTSIEAEHIRSIRAALSVILDDRHAKVIQVSSPEPGDGKTTLAANLAVAEAQAGKRVLLIDADLRRPCVHTLFRIALGEGLSETLSGHKPFREVLRTSAIENLTLLTAGTPPANPAEILSSPRWPRLLDDMRPDFDLILVDSPPLLAVSDPCETARQTDGLLLVARLGKNRRPAGIRTRELIKSHNLPILGIIANGLSEEDDPGYGYYPEYSSRPSLEPAVQRMPESQLVGV